MTPFLWVAQSRLFSMNSGVVIGGGQACLIDPGIYPDELDSIARFVAEQGAMAQAIVLTHSHWDHILGPERFPGVRVIAQARYPATARSTEDELLGEIDRWGVRDKVERDARFRIPQPDETFDETMEIQVGSLSLRLDHTPGHAPDELTAYHAESGTLWASDILSDIEIPLVSHNLAAYERTLEMLSGWEVRVLVPGHGTPATDPRVARNRIERDKAYLAELRARVERAVGAGKTVEEAVASCEDMAFYHPDENRDSHRLNVESVYLELGGRADASKVGWGKDRP